MRLTIVAKFAHRVTRRVRDDSGFTLVELVVTMFVISAVLLGLITVQLQSLSSVGLAKQRQAATALGNRTVEQLRAIPYDTVTAGLRNCDLSGDANITGTTFAPTYSGAVSEPLATNSTACGAATNPTPLYPHVQQTTATRVGSTQYRVRSYVSKVSATQDLGYYLTVVVDWSNKVTGNKLKTTAVRSRLFSPTGCATNSTATRPFAGPCQAFLYSDAGIPISGITVASVTAGAPLIAGNSVTRLEAKLPGLSARTQNEQIVSSQSIATASEVTMTTTSGTSGGGGDTGASAADTDPASGTGSAPASASVVSYSGSSSLTSSGSNGAFTVAVPSSSGGSAYSTTAGAATPACQDDSAVSIVSGQACSTSNVTPSGTYIASMDLNLPGRNLGNVILARIATPGTANTWRAFGARAVLPVPGHCTTTSGIGCVAAGVRRTLGTSATGFLATAGAGDTLPAGWDNTKGMASLTGFSAIAAAESGITPGAPSASRAANTLTYWTGTGYNTVALGAAGASYPLGTAVGNYRVAGLPLLDITMTGTVTVDPVTAVSTGAAPCQTTACSVTSTVGTVRVSVQYDLVQAGLPLGSFVVTSDLGSTSAQTTYKAAPSA
ncbi:MAG: prepilin-type N-terminal cleavage/methylation domain-containing protein [Sporichthyaceae bacterium]